MTGKFMTAAGLSVAAALALAVPARATTVTDPMGDFIPEYTGPHQADLDVTSFSVSYNSSLAAFLIQSTMAGVIDPALAGFYVIGVNTGTGPIDFAAIGRPDVKFNQVVIVQKDGSARVGATALDPGAAIVSGDAFSVTVPLSLLPTTGFDAMTYGFNIWPRSGQGQTEVISDFAPDNATISAAGAVPEIATWAMMLAGFGATGFTLRRARSTSPMRLA